MLRKPAVAGRFYPAKPDELIKAIEGYLQPTDKSTQAVGILVPHAGYMYSGHVAGAVYSCVDVGSSAVVLGPNHTGLGPPLSIMRSGEWVTPLGQMEIDQALCERLMAADPQLAGDVEAHRFEHAIEVQLPFLQQLGGSSVKFAPIIIGTRNWQRLEALGQAIGAVLAEMGQRVLIIASSDMNHYESDAVTRMKDRMAIEQILAMDPRGLYEVVGREDISMCGCGPAIAMMTAAKLLGSPKAELIKYATSGDVSGDFDRVVGYAGLLFT